MALDAEQALSRCSILAAIMTKAMIDVFVLSRVERTAQRVRETVQGSYERLQSSIDGNAAVENVLTPAKSDTARSEIVGAVADAVRHLSERLLADLRILCEVTLANGVIANSAHIALASALPPPRPDDIVDLRRQRLLRMPVDQAMKIVSAEMEGMCDEVNDLMATLASQPRLRVVRH